MDTLLTKTLHSSRFRQGIILFHRCWQVTSSIHQHAQSSQPSTTLRPNLNEPNPTTTAGTVISGATSLFADRVAGHQPLHPLPPGWNTTDVRNFWIDARKLACFSSTLQSSLAQPHSWAERHRECNNLLVQTPSDFLKQPAILLAICARARSVECEHRADH